MPGVSKRLSLITDGSSIKASLGKGSGVVAEVVQAGPGPWATVMVHPIGGEGGAMLSKFPEKGVPVQLGQLTVSDSTVLVSSSPLSPPTIRNCPPMTVPPV